MRLVGPAATGSAILNLLLGFTTIIMKKEVWEKVMLKIDGHQHFWDLDNIAIPWVTAAPERAPLVRNFLPAQLETLLKERSVAGSIVVQAAESEAETDWLLGLPEIYPFVKGVVGWVDLTAPDLADRLERFKSLGPYCGTRYFLVKETDGRPSLEQAALPGLKTLADHDLACDLLFPPSYLNLFIDLFERIPHARWVINHLGLPDFRSGGFATWQTEMRQLSRFPNVYCKVSGLLALADPAQDLLAQATECFETVLEIFGPDRLLWGSDWPVSLLSGTYLQVHDLLETLLAPLSQGEQEAIWAKTALKVYKLPGV